MELAILIPAVLVLTLAVVQGALWWYAREAALAAAREGVEQGRLYQGGGSVDAADRASEAARNLGGDLLSDLRVDTGGSTPERVRVEVSGYSLAILPGVRGIRVVQHAEAPRERVTRPGD
ncbi:pilus assembly protein [Streptomyces sp. SID3343]|nr:TadE/TadG family type IV pilus assembly protein [Streptomyces sp. SID3343]MYV97637.1 pilus assembly protein [Streptomyces sp. SID3343]